MSLRQVWYSFFGALGAALIVLGSVWFYIHRQDADIQTVAVHVAVDSLPFLAAIVFALWPEVSKVRIGWRVTILAVGLLWTCLLARRDYLDVQASRRDLGTAVNTAVSDATACLAFSARSALVRCAAKALTKS